MLSKHFVTFTLASRLMNPWYLVYTFLGSSSVFYSPNTTIYRYNYLSFQHIFLYTTYMRIEYTAALPVPFLFPPPEIPQKKT